MFKTLRRKWKIAVLIKKINQLSRNILEELKRKSDFETLEYGNLRKGSEWGSIQNGNISWTYLIDLIIGKPVLYIISYNLDENSFTCYAKTPRTNFSSVFQFKTNNFQELNFRLLELAKHIPSLRERMLREIIYQEAKQGPKKKWYKPFVTGEKIHNHLESIIGDIAGENKITENEANRLRAYAKDLA